jgi:nicotinamide phosphoribosyltransferase
MIFGMGGGLLQKELNRDTQRFAFKSSAQKRDGQWIPVSKTPLDKTKASKPGRLMLTKDEQGHYATLAESTAFVDELVTVFENGELKQTLDFDEVRENATLPAGRTYEEVLR